MVPGTVDAELGTSGGTVGVGTGLSEAAGLVTVAESAGCIAMDTGEALAAQPCAEFDAGMNDAGIWGDAGIWSDAGVPGDAGICVGTGIWGDAGLRSAAGM